MVIDTGVRKPLRRVVVDGEEGSRCRWICRGRNGRSRLGVMERIRGVKERVFSWKVE